MGTQLLFNEQKIKRTQKLIEYQNLPLVYPIFLKRFLVFSILLFSSISLHCSLKQSLRLLKRLAHLSLCAYFFGILHSAEYIFPFILCLSLLFLSQLFVRPPQIAILPFCISFSGGWFWSLPPVQCSEPLSIVLQTVYQIQSLESISHFHCIIIRGLIQVIPE